MSQVDSTQPQSLPYKQFQKLRADKHKIEVSHRKDANSASVFLASAVSAPLLSAFSPVCKALIEGSNSYNVPSQKCREITITGGNQYAIKEIPAWLYRLCNDKRARLDIPAPETTNYFLAHEAAVVLGMDFLAERMMKVIGGKLSTPMLPADVFKLAKIYPDNHPYMEKVIQNLGKMVYQKDTASYNIWTFPQNRYQDLLREEHPGLWQAVKAAEEGMRQEWREKQKVRPGKKGKSGATASPTANAQGAPFPNHSLAHASVLVKSQSPTWAGIVSGSPPAVSPKMNPLPAPACAEPGQTRTTAEELFKE